MYIMSIKYIYLVTLGCYFHLCIWQLSESTQLFPEIRYGFFRKNQTLSGMVTTDGFISEVDTSSRRRCGDLCLSFSACVAFFHNSYMGSCKVHDISFRNVTHTPSPGWSLYELVGDSNDTHSDTQATCAMGFQLISTFCLKIRNTSITAVAAQQECSNLYPGSSLVKITSSDKQSIMENLLVPFNGIGKVFIQGTRHDNGSTSQWLYDDGTKLVYVNWNSAEGQPNNSSGQIYVAMLKSKNWKWHDLSNSHSGAVICELEPN